MSSREKVVPIRPAEADLRERVRELEEELEQARAQSGRDGRREGPLVALARLLQIGRSGLTWENVS
ncbi:MAG TPA: hypothetical protein VF310_17310, partial [Vicinamibacteria bacterium]